MKGSIAGPARVTNSLGEELPSPHHHHDCRARPDPGDGGHLQGHVGRLAVPGQVRSEQGSSDERDSRDEDADHAAEVDVLGLVDDVAEELAQQVVAPAQ